ncbi:MAG: TusE/DsrC/DsvC family sulfur relay protein [Gammaproteobacteria bacterium]
MNMEVEGKIISTDNEGYLLNIDDWNESVMNALIKQHEADGHKPLSETAIGLIGYFRQHYQKNKTHPGMNELLRDLAMQESKDFNDTDEYKNFLYEMFPHGPIQKLSKLAGLPNPGNENES